MEAKASKISRAEVAKAYFADHFNCAQSVFVAFAPDYGLPVDDSLKIACAFGGGMGRQQKTCGAVTGALMALGLKYGKALHDKDEKKSLTYAKTVQFFDEFKKTHGSVNCCELLDGLDMNNAVDSVKLNDLRLFELRCPKYVVDAVKIANKIIADE